MADSRLLYWDDSAIDTKEGVWMMGMYATDKDKREYEEGMAKALDDALIEAIGCNSLNSKDLRGAGLKKDLTPKAGGVA